MKRRMWMVGTAVILAMAWTAPAGAQTDVKEYLERFLSAEPAADTRQGRVARGLKEALLIGIETAIDALGRPDGFLDNELVRIPVPESLALVETTLRKAGQGKLVDDFIASMNRAASKAVPEGTRIFMGAVGRMSIDDAVTVLNGDEQAATRYFEKRTREDLRAAFHPIVEESTAAAEVTSYYKAMDDLYQTYGKKLLENESVRALTGLLKGGAAEEPPEPADADLDAYITRKALDGLFVMIARQEQRIRKEPAARVTDLLRDIFGGGQE